MRITTKSRFAVAAMVDIALREQGGPVSLTDISKRHHISVSYLEQMFSRLRQHGLVKSTRGPGGGYTLGRKPQDISVVDIVSAINGPARRAPGAKAADQNLTQELWTRLDAKMADYMHSVRLSELVTEQLARGVQVEERPRKRGVFAKPAATPVKTTAPNSVFAWGNALLTQG